MRIIGGKDYYDSGLQYGRDDDLLFVRNSRESMTDAEIKDPGFCTYDLKKGERDFSSLDQNVRATIERNLGVEAGPNGRWGKDFLSTVRVLFCGKLYRGVTFTPLTGKKRVYFWDKETLQRFLEPEGLQFRPYTRARSWFERWRDEQLDEFFQPLDHTDWAIKNRVTIAVKEDHDRISTPWSIDTDQLKDFQFQRKFDSFTAFQMLSEWTMNLPRNPNPMVEITDDKVKIAKHGFDKMSFRKEKQPKRAKRG